MIKNIEQLVDSSEVKRLEKLAATAKNQKQVAPKLARVPYETPLPMAVSKVEVTSYGVQVSVECYVDGKPITKQFRFYDKYPAYLEGFCYNINPEAETVNDTVGTFFWGEVVRSGSYENIKALSEEEVKEFVEEEEFE